MPWLKYNRPGNWGIALGSSMRVEEPEVDVNTGLVKNPKAVSQSVVRNFQAGIVHLHAGLNKMISQETWDELKKHPQVQAALESGDLEEIVLPDSAAKKTIKVDEPLAPEMAEYPGTLKDMKASDALALISECSQEKVLEGWQQTETRAAVVKAISKQLEVLKRIVTGKN